MIADQSKQTIEQQEKLERYFNTIAELVVNDDLFSNSLEAIFDIITETAANSLQIKRSSIWLYDEIRSSICCKNLFDNSRNNHNGELILRREDYPEYFRALDAERIIDVSDALNDKRTAEFTENYLKPLGISALLDAPIRHGDEVIGVICCEHVGETRNWSLEDKSFVSSLADFLSLAMNVNRRDEISDALKASEERFRSFFGHAPLAVAIVDRNGRVTLSNPAMHDLTGYEAGELADFTLLKLSHPDDKSNDVALFKSILDGKQKTFTSWKRIICKDGQMKWGDFTASIIRDSSGIPTYGIVMIQDITARVLAEEKLKDNEERLEIMFKFAPDAYYMMDTTGVFLDANNAAEKLVGYEKTELIGRNFLESKLLRTRHLSRASKLLARNLMGLPVGPELFEIKTKDGDILLLEIRTYPVKIKQKTVILGIARDVTEQKTAENQLAERERQYHTIFQGVNDVIVFVNTKGVISDVNSKVKDIFGYEPAEIIGKSFLSLGILSSGTIKRVAKLFRSAIRDGAIEKLIELDLKHRDGHFVPVEISTTIIKLDNKTIGIAPIIRDISTRKRDQEILNIQHDLAIRLNTADSLDETLAYCLDIVTTKTGLESGAILLENESSGDFIIANSMGFDADSLELLSRIPQNSTMFDQICQRGKKILSTQDIDPENWNISLLKTMKLIGYLPIKNRSKVIGCLMVASRENDSVTEKTDKLLDSVIASLETAFSKSRTREALFESENRYRSLFDQVPDGIYRSTHAGQFVDVNPALVSMLGYDSEEELKQVNISDDLYIDPDNRKDITEEELEGGVSQFQLRKKDGSILWVEDRGHYVFDQDGEIIFHEGILRDITNRKNLELTRGERENQLRQSQKLESIGTLASGVAHEINNPLMGMIYFAELIKDDVGSSELKEYCSSIMNEGERIATIVSNLLSFARQDHRSTSLAQINDRIETALALVQTMLVKDQIHIMKELSEELPQIHCRSQQIEQVLVNLFTNARDALNERYPESNENKIIKVSTSSFNENGSQFVRTQIIDHGIGIDQEVISRIFDPFFTTKNRATGTGLGLAVSYGIIQEHKGEFNVESDPGAYTRISFDLPV